MLDQPDLFQPSATSRASTHSAAERPKPPAVTPAAAPLPALLTLALIRQHFLPVGERTLFRMISSGRFPKADIQMGGKLRLWKKETVEKWIGSETATRRV